MRRVSDSLRRSNLTEPHYEAPGGFLGGSFLPFFVDAAKQGTFSGLRLLTTNPAKLAGDYDPASILVKQVDYEKPDTLVAALQGVDVVVSAMASPWGAATDTLGQRLIEAAAQAGVKVYFPSDVRHVRFRAGRSTHACYKYNSGAMTTMAIRSRGRFSRPS